MNKIEECRDKLIQEAGPEAAYGFNACMFLELPVKFVEWKDEGLIDFSIRKVGSDYQIDGSSKFINLKTLYDYWIENIYKPE